MKSLRSLTGSERDGKRGSERGGKRGGERGGKRGSGTIRLSKIGKGW